MLHNILRKCSFIWFFYTFKNGWCSVLVSPFRIKHQKCLVGFIIIVYFLKRKHKKEKVWQSLIFFYFFVLRRGGRKYCVFYPSVIKRKKKIPKEMVRRVVKETHIYYLLLHINVCVYGDVRDGQEYFPLLSWLLNKLWFGKSLSHFVHLKDFSPVYGSSFCGQVWTFFSFFFLPSEC